MPVLDPCVGPGLQRLEAVEDLAVGVVRAALVADAALDLALSLLLARLAGVDVELQLPGVTAIGRVHLAPTASALRHPGLTLSIRSTAGTPPRRQKQAVWQACRNRPA